ncbi:hypothetical protein RhiJN_06425 [Ceratobasidium sp. AG-Ba]|nr:hypothetical protein RhiJN_06425 [Ceratobasidium sp. AG-Ba]QRW07339.1 hypothetical protein RhiLY_06338 [Ceratobasidium sp. AG-Ba]
MGFITQTFGNSFWLSSTASTGQTDVQQRASPSTKKYRPKHKLSKDITRTIPSLPESSAAQTANIYKKRRHDSSDAASRPPYGIAEPPSRPSISSGSVASDEPLILQTPKGKGAASGNSPLHHSNPNQSAYAAAAWTHIPQSPPRLQARPPTTNSLDNYERSQLVRRSRKLEAILGETPRMLDVEEDGAGIETALTRLEGRAVIPISTPQRPGGRRSLTLGPLSIGSATPVSASRHSFLLNDENSSSPGERSSPRIAGPGPRFGRSRSTARGPPVLRLSPTPTRENMHPYFSRRHSSDLSLRRGSLNNLDMNVGVESGSDMCASKAQSLDASSIHSSTMPTFARSRSPLSFLDSGSISSRVSLSGSIGPAGVSLPCRSEAVDPSLPPSPTTPITPVLTQAEDARRKMRKLARHLGESVPVDLVLGNAGGRHAPHDLRTEAAAPQYLQIPAAAAHTNKPKNSAIAARPFSLGKPPGGHRKAQSVWKNSRTPETPMPHRLVRRASSAEQLRVDTAPPTQMTAEEKARNVHRAMKMLQLFGAPPPHELYTTTKSCSLDLAPDSAQAVLNSPSSDRRASVNSLRDLAYILDHDNRNSLLALIGDMSDAQSDPALSPFADSFGCESTSATDDNKEPFEARRARAIKLAKFFGVSYRDLFDAVCSDDTPQGDKTPTEANVSAAIEPPLQQQSVAQPGSEVMTNNGMKWVEPKSVDEVLDRLRAMKASR